MIGDDVAVLPSEQVKALMTVLMAKTIQKPQELVLTDDAGGYVRTANFLSFLGLLPGDPLREWILEPMRAQGLQKATEGWEPFLRLQLVEQADQKDRFANCDPDAPKKDPDKGGENEGSPQSPSIPETGEPPAPPEA